MRRLRNISNTDQLVNTVNGKEVIKAGKCFQTEKADTLLRAYKYLFKEVSEEEAIANTTIEEEVVEEAEEVEVKKTKKTLSSKNK